MSICPKCQSDLVSGASTCPVCAASDAHAIAPSRGEDKRLHRFLRVKGGFVNIAVNPGSTDEALIVEHCDVLGNSVNRRVFKKT